MEDARIHPTDRGVEHPADPRERMPVHLEAGEGPPESSPRQTPRDDRVVGHVLRIVEIDEAEAGDARVGDGGDGGQGKADGKAPFQGAPMIPSAFEPLMRETASSPRVLRARGSHHGPGRGPFIAGHAFVGRALLLCFGLGAATPTASAPTSPATAPTPPSTAPAPPSTAPEPPASAPDDRRERRARAASLLRTGKAVEAAALYAEILAAGPTDAEAMAGRVRALLASDRWREGLEAARRYAPGDAAPPVARAALGEALYRAGLLREAAAVLDSLAAVPAPPARALLMLGLVRAADGRDDEAASLFARAVETDPSDRDVLRGAAGAAPTRARAIELLGRYLELSAGDDPDRIEGARGTLRLFRALGERAVWVPASRLPRAEIPLRRLRDRSGRATGLVIEMATGRGKPVRLLLDTGSSGLFLVERIAQRAGFAPLAEETVFGGGGEGKHPSSRGLFASAAFGGVSFSDALASTTTEEIEPMGLYHGVLGLSAFSGYRVTIDLVRDRLVLERAEGGDSGEGETPGQTAGEPWWDVGGQMLVEAGARGAPQGLFMLDTGASASLLSTAYAASCPRASVGEPTGVRGFGGTLRDARSVRGVLLILQGLEAPPSVMTASDLTSRSRLGGVEIAGFIGLDLLDRSIVAIDTRSHRVIVRRPHQKG